MTGTAPPARRSRGVAVAAVLAGAGGALLAGSRTWLEAVVPGAAPVAAPGSSAAPGLGALALVAGAGVVALVTAGRAVRLAVAGLLVLDGAAMAALALRAVTDPAGAVGPAVVAATGIRGAAPARVTLTGWPWLALAAATLVVLGGAVALARARRWPGPARRYDRPAPGAPARSVRASPGDPGTSSGAAVAAPAASGPEPGAPRAAGRGAGGRGREGVHGTALDDWEALSRGEDPTDPEPPRT